MNNNALVNGELPIKQARHNADVGPANTVSQAWILADQNANPPGATQYFSFNTPTNVATGKSPKKLPKRKLRRAPRRLNTPRWICL